MRGKYIQKTYLQKNEQTEQINKELVRAVLIKSIEKELRQQIFFGNEDSKNTSYGRPITIICDGIS